MRALPASAMQKGSTGEQLQDFLLLEFRERSIILHLRQLCRRALQASNSRSTWSSCLSSESNWSSCICVSHAEGSYK